MLNENNVLSFKNKLREIVKPILPNHKVVIAFWIFNESAWQSIFVTKSLETTAVEHESIPAATYHPQQFVFLLELLDIRYELFWLLGVRS